jgi:PhnB protein
MAQINPYLTFDSNCREAMEFYKQCFGGELFFQTFADAPMESTEETKNRIMHARLQNGDLMLMASDSMPGHPVTPGTNVTLSIHPTSDEETTMFFSALSEDGKITMPLQDTFWGARFGMLTDKFGFNWMINFEKEKK